MKIRNGFVSNSSSSSFLISISNKEQCDSCKKYVSTLISLLDKLFASNWGGSKGNAEDHLYRINSELEAINKDISWAEDKIKCLEKILLNEDAMRLYVDWTKLDSNLRDWRYIDRSCNGVKNRVEASIGSIKFKLNDCKSKQADLLNKKVLIENLPLDKDLYLVDLGYGTEEYGIMESLIKDGTVELIEKKTT